MTAEQREWQEKQIEAAQRIVYEDVASTLRLDANENDALLQVLLDQQMQEQASWSSDIAENAARHKEWEQGRKAAIQDLLGPARAAAFDEYDRSIMARYEVMELQQALRSSGTPMSETQRKELISTVIERRAYELEFAPVGNAPNAEMQQAIAQIAQRDERMLSASRGVLTAEQFAKFDEYQRSRREGMEAAARTDGQPPPVEKK